MAIGRRLGSWICALLSCHHPPLCILFNHQKLTRSDQANLASVSRCWNVVVTPHLYRTVYVHCSGKIEQQDSVLRMLDAFVDPEFPHLCHTTDVCISGSWYHTYKEIEAGLGQHRLLSPAVRMFNSMVAACVSRMPQLRRFM